MEARLLVELHTTLKQEVSLWRQKSRIQWLKGGEQNSRFFHTSILICRRQNIINKLKDAAGCWAEDADELKQMAKDFYQTLYTKECYLQLDLGTCAFPPLDHSERAWLNKDVAPVEVKNVLFQMVVDEGPGPDGFPPSFFQRHWGIVGRSGIQLSMGCCSLDDFPERPIRR